LEVNNSRKGIAKFEDNQLTTATNDQPGTSRYVPDWTSPSVLDFRLTSPFGLHPFVHCPGVFYRAIMVIKGAAIDAMTRINNVSIRSNERKHPRFPVDYPVLLKFRNKGERQELGAMSNNISQGGVLLQAPSPVPPDCEVQFVMTIQTGQTCKPIQLKGAGRVVRLEQYSSGRGFGIAIECKRPIHRILRQVRPFLA
jgi:hypothetical protein